MLEASPAFQHSKAVAELAAELACSTIDEAVIEAGRKDALDRTYTNGLLLFVGIHCCSHNCRASSQGSCGMRARCECVV